MPISLQLSRGYQLYKYELIRKIGDGGFGEVWLSEDKTLGCEYAIKILDSASGMPVQQRLIEAYIGHVLEHNNVVHVHQADVIPVGSENYVIIAMDYMPEGPITGLANPDNYLPLPKAIGLAKDILRGLEYLHGYDIFHNDIKPENVLIGPHGQGMITDYGIVGISKDGAPVSPRTFYKIHAAPEVVRQNEINERTDVYQAGLTLFRMLVGLNSLRTKFQTTGEDAYYRSAAEGKLISTADFPVHVPRRVRHIVRKAIRADADERYQSALDMRRDLERLNYPGYWTVNESGEFVGYDSRYSYRYEKKRRRDGGFSVVAWRKNLNTGRETRYTRYGSANVSRAQAQTKIKEFIRDVVDGE